MNESTDSRAAGAAQLLPGRTVLITGAASGLGKATAQAAATHGAQVWIGDLDPVAAESTAAELVRAGLAARSVRLDVASDADWGRALATIEEHSGGLDGLVNNAGISVRHGITGTSLAEWERVLAVNTTGVFLGMQHCHRLLAARTGSAVVNIASISAMLGYYSASYAASKWAVRGLSKTAALEFAEHGIRVNAVCPGLVDTPLLHTAKDGGAYVNSNVRSIPMDRIGQPEEIAAAVIFLLSAQASYVSGSEIVVDGGLLSGGTYHRILDGVSPTGTQEKGTQS